MHETTMVFQFVQDDQLIQVQVTLCAPCLGAEALRVLAAEGQQEYAAGAMRLQVTRAPMPEHAVTPASPNGGGHG